MTMREHADSIIQAAIQSALPDVSVKKQLRHIDIGSGRVVLIAVGKGGWQMANAACQMLGDRISDGVVLTKYGHVKGEIPGVRCFEAGHPIPDENGFFGTQVAIEAVQGLTAEDTVLFLLSGGGSALFEKPLVSSEELESITAQLLACGADIAEMNTIRKRISAVKGGKFATLCMPAKVECVVLSDVLGNRADVIDSGPACPDSSTCEDAQAIVDKYSLQLSEKAMKLLQQETPKELDNVTLRMIGSVTGLCEAAAEQCRKLGYETMVLTDHLDCEAREAGIFLSDIAQYHRKWNRKMAFIAGGETVVHLKGHGKGGRNQELALAAAAGIAGMANTAVFSVGSDGTDGVTDAAGGYVNGDTELLLSQQGVSIFQVLEHNDSYHALQKIGGLIITGATGTNVNDIAVVLLG